MSDQNGNDSESIALNPPVPPREDLVNTAAKFLSSPNVQKSPHDMKISFLKRKGLSEAEIELALKRSEAALLNRAVEPVSSYPVSFHPPPRPVSYWGLHPRWLTFRDVVNTIMLFAGVLYAVYWIYKKYIWNYLFGDRRKKRSSDERLTDIEANLSSVGQSVVSLRESVDSKGPLIREIQSLKDEVASVKKMLLGRKQFPLASPAPLSIPAWQIGSSPVQISAEEKEEEGAATNGSDSSLEMIKE